MSAPARPGEIARRERLAALPRPCARDADAEGSRRRRAAARGGHDVWALRDVSLARRAGRGGRARRPQRLGQVDAAADPRGDHQADVAGASRRAGAIGSLLELGAGFHPDFTGRENVFLNGSIQGLRAPADPRALRRDRRVRRARARDRPAGAHVLVRDVHAARVRDRGVPRRRRPAARRGVRRRRRGVPAEVLRPRSPSSSSAAARSSSSRTTPRRSSGCASARCSCATARSRSTGRRTRRSCATGARSPRRSTRPSAAQGCASGDGRGDDRRASARRPRRRRARAVPRGRAARARGRGRGVHAADPPPLLQLELRDEAGLLVADDGRRHAAARLGRAAAASALRLDVPALPLAVRALPPRGSGLPAATAACSTGSTTRSTFLVYPDGEGRGLVRLEGTWTADTNDGRR